MPSSTGEPRPAHALAPAKALGTAAIATSRLLPSLLDKRTAAVAFSSAMTSNTLRGALDNLYLLAGYLAGLFLVAIFLLMMGLSVGRQVGVNIPAGDDLTSWCMAAMAFLALAHTFRSGELIRVGLLVGRLQGRIRHAVELGCLVIGAAFVGFFAWYAVLMTYDSWRFNDMAQGVLAIPIWIPQVGYAGGLVILFIAFVDEFVHVLTGHAPRYERPPESAEDAVERAVHTGI
jgi:TRAP-type C4-dicarboxylate transport system permease small subunit